MALRTQHVLAPAVLALLAFVGIASWRRVDQRPSEPEDQVRLAILRQALPWLASGRADICIGVLGPGDRSPRSPAPELLSALRSERNVVPIAACTDPDERSGPRRDAFFVEAQPLEWQGSTAARMTITAWSRVVAEASTSWNARRTPQGWEVDAAEYRGNGPGPRPDEPGTPRS